jgi:hypothetical protein
MKVCWISSIALSTKMIIWFFVLHSVMWSIIFIALHMLNHSCIPRINPTYSNCVVLFYMDFIC